MRRSKAPSVLKEAKRYSNSKEDGHCSDPEHEQYAWGSRNVKKCRYESRKIFSVVWRDVSTKKHKTWKGDGTLEVSNDFLKAVLKDESGKYMGCSTKVNRNDLVPDHFMVIGGKEVEIQSEIVDEYELDLHHQRQTEKRMEEWISTENSDKEQNRHKGGFKFKPVLILNSPQIPSGTKITNNVKYESYNSTAHLQMNVSNEESTFSTSNLYAPKLQSCTKDEICKEIICFLRPSDLQQFLFQKALEYISSFKAILNLEEIHSFSIDSVLQNICNHPSLINHGNTTNKLVQHLISTLPDWTEMGPFDSCKLEFVQYLLSDLKKINRQTCAILAKNLNVLNMLQGLCDFMNIKCMRLEDLENKSIIEFCLSENTSTRVLLVNSEKMFNSFGYLEYCKRIIIFEEFSKNLNTFCKQKNYKNIIIYNLVTAFSIEELLLLGTYNNNIETLLDELVDITKIENDICYLHSKIECNCFISKDESKNQNHFFKKNWDHLKSPFDEQLLKIYSLENLSENIVTIFSRKVSE